LFFCCFQFGLTFESIKELGGASQNTLALFNVDIRHKHGKDNVLPDALSQKHQLKVVYVGKTELQKEVQLVNRYDEFAKEMKQNIQKESNHTSTCEMDYYGISRIGSMFREGGLRMCY